MQRYLPIVAAAALMIGAAAIQGSWTERWKAFPELELYAEQLKRVPMEFGEWKGETAPATDQRILDLAGAVGSLSRTYRNDRNEAVSVFIICGRLTDIFQHSPDRCYPAAGFEITGEKINQSVETGNGVAEFITTTFMKADPSGNQNLRIYWDWCADGTWKAPMRPKDYKWVFAGQRAIYKLYVVTPNVGREVAADQNPAVDFIRVLIPELDRAFAPAFAAAKGKASSAPVPDATPAKSDDI
jgi:hypothetical protein